MNNTQPETTNETTNPEIPKKKMKRWQKVLLIVLISILGLMLTLAIVFYAVFSHYYNKMNIISLDELEKNESIISVPDETDYPEEGGTSYITQTVTDENGNQLPPITIPVTVPPVTDDPQVEQDNNDKIDQNINNNQLIKVDDNVKNILLIGTDGRTVNERGRSDTMILLTINENNGQIVMTSFMRDIYLHIPEIDSYNRINAAYSSGGISLLIKTIRENFKLQIDRYVRVNFVAFEYIVDTMGGVDINLTQEEINFIGMSGKAEPGVVHLNGAQALKYCRCRYVRKGNLTGDFARTARQREFLTIMSEKLRGQSFFELTELLDIFLPHVTTNLTQGEMLSLLTNVPTYLNYDIVSARLPVDGSWKYATIRRMSVLSVNFDKNIEELKRLINGG